MKNALLAAAAAVPLAAILSCSSPSPQPVRRASPPMAPAAVENERGAEKAGREMAAGLFARDPLTADERLLRYVGLVGRTAAGALPLAVRYRFAVTQSDVPYSLAYPGRFVVVSRGMLFVLSSEADLAVTLSREICRAPQVGNAGEASAESSDPAFEVKLDACGARLASLAGYDVSGFLHVLESLRARAVSAREMSDLQGRIDAYKTLPEFLRGGKTLADRFRSSAIL